MYYFLKVAISAVIIVAISELGKRSSVLAGLLASLPLVSLLGMLWLYLDTRDVEQVAQLSSSIFWLVLPSLVLFVLLPLLLRWDFGFYASLAVSCAATAFAYGGMVLLLTKLGIRL